MAKSRHKRKDRQVKRRDTTSTKKYGKHTTSKQSAPNIDADDEPLPFDYEFLSLSRTESSKPASLLWMSLGMIVAQIILFAIFFPKTFTGSIKGFLIFIKVNVLQEFLFYLSIVATFLVSLDIYKIDKLKKFESRIERGIFQLHRSFFSACKQGITISGRGPNDIIDWQINSLTIVLIIYLSIQHNFEKDIQIEVLNINQFIAIICAIICAKIITIGARLSWLFEYVLETPIFGLLLFFNAQIAKYLEIPMDSRTFGPSFLYIFGGYWLYCGTKYFELRKSKLIFWGLIIFISLPYLIVKFASNLIPFIIYYPLYLVTKIAVILKPKSYLRHLALILLITIMVLSRYISK